MKTACHGNNFKINTVAIVSSVFILCSHLHPPRICNLTAISIATLLHQSWHTKHYGENFVAASILSYWETHVLQILQHTDISYIITRGGGVATPQRGNLTSGIHITLWRRGGGYSVPLIGPSEELQCGGVVPIYLDVHFLSVIIRLVIYRKIILVDHISFVVSLPYG